MSQNVLFRTRQAPPNVPILMCPRPGQENLTHITRLSYLGHCIRLISVDIPSANRRRVNFRR